MMLLESRAQGLRGAWNAWLGKLPAGADPVALALLTCGFLALAGPLFWDWTRGTFASGTQGHEPVILGVSAWLLFRQRVPLAALPSAPLTLLGNLLFAAGLLLYVLGRWLDLRLSLMALAVLVAALLVRFKGVAALKLTWFALIFVLFAAPLPLSLVLAVTGPLKTAVSTVATFLLGALGFDIGQSGVVITIGQYQLLVTEACAGLQTMFTLEAMGLLYINLMNYGSAWRSALMSMLAVPIAFAANVVRVVVLALITYYFGDAAGQGFLHGVSGMVLFAIALALLIGVDRSIGRVSLRAASL